MFQRRNKMPGDDCLQYNHIQQKAKNMLFCLSVNRKENLISKQKRDYDTRKKKKLLGVKYLPKTQIKQVLPHLQQQISQ